MASFMSNKRAVAALLVAALALACQAQSQDQRGEPLKGGIEGLANMALDVVLSGITDTARVLEKTSKPIQEIKATIDEEAVEFIKRIQQDSRVKAALEKLKQNTPVDQGIASLKKLADNVGANLDRLGKDLNKQLKPLADQAKPFLDNLEKKRQEIMEAHERRVAQYKAEDALHV